MSRQEKTRAPHQTNDASQSNQQAARMPVRHKAPLAVTVQKAHIHPALLTHAEVRQLQRTIGNRAVMQLLSGGLRLPASPEGMAAVRESTETVQKKDNNTGLPANLKPGVENLSNMSMDDVQVHYNSSKPAQVQALAYTQGTDIHVAPGQEQYLAHEAWHVVQQKQGRVKPTSQIGGLSLNDDPALEREASNSGSRAAWGPLHKSANRNLSRPAYRPAEVTQMVGKKGSAEPKEIPVKEKDLSSIEVGSASRNKKIKKYKKNPDWEIVFRKLSGVATFKPEREGSTIYELKESTVAPKENQSRGGIAVSRNPDFTLDLLATGVNKVVYASVLPPNYGLDLEAEFLDAYKQEKGEELPEGYSMETRADLRKQFLDPDAPDVKKEGVPNRLSREVVLQRNPLRLIIGWAIRQQTTDKYGNTPSVTYQDNPDFRLPEGLKLEELPTYERFVMWKAHIERIQNVEAKKLQPQTRQLPI